MILDAACSVNLSRRLRRKVSINVTSLIDVLFLLLIFFMVSSTFAEQPRIKLELPQAASAEVERIGQWNLTITRDEKVFLNGEEIQRSQIIEALRHEVEQDPEKALVLKADRQVSYGLFIEILDLAKSAGVKKISALTRPGGATEEKNLL